jgi:hypothetical protein
MRQCVRCGMKIGLFKTGGKLEEGQRYYEVKQDPGTLEKSAELKEISPYSSARPGRLCKLCWAKWQAEQEEGRALVAAAKQRAAKVRAKEGAREEALRSRAVALDRMALAGADALKQYAATGRNATRSEILALGADGNTFGVRDYRVNEPAVTFFASANGTVREWTIVRTGPATWMIASSRSRRSP